MSAYIRAVDIGLDLPVYSQDQRSVRASLSLFLRAAFEPPRRVFRTTLDGISFQINAGDRVGIVGRNGAGKSTLLRMLVGAYPPTRGSLDIRGSKQALLNLSLGFSADATIVENVMLRSIAMGLRPAQASSIIEEVLDFSELRGKAGDRLRTLSSGQRMRLGFALATAAQHEILIMDEWISTGDAAFVAKAQERLGSRVDDASIVVIASHSPKLLRRVCNKAIFLEDGKLVSMGGVDEVLALYHSALGQSCP